MIDTEAKLAKAVKDAEIAYVSLIHDTSYMPNKVSFVANYLSSNGVTIPTRCEKCGKRNKNAKLRNGTVHCMQLDLYMPADAFCSYGEEEG